MAARLLRAIGPFVLVVVVVWINEVAVLTEVWIGVIVINTSSSETIVVVLHCTNRAE